MKKTIKCAGLLTLLLLVGFVAYGSDMPFEVGDILEITPTVPLRKDITIIQSAKVQEILGRWVFVKAKVGGSDESFWINLDNVLLLKIGKPAKK